MRNIYWIITFLIVIAAIAYFAQGTQTTTSQKLLKTNVSNGASELKEEKQGTENSGDGDAKDLPYVEAPVLSHFQHVTTGNVRTGQMTNALQGLAILQFSQQEKMMIFDINTIEGHESFKFYWNAYKVIATNEEHIQYSIEYEGHDDYGEQATVALHYSYKNSLYAVAVRTSGTAMLLAK